MFPEKRLGFSKLFSPILTLKTRKSASRGVYDAVVRDVLFLVVPKNNRISRRSSSRNNAAKRSARRLRRSEKLPLGWWTFL